MNTSDESMDQFTYEDDPENPGWTRWDIKDHTLYNHAVIGPLLLRREGDNTCRVRMRVQRHHLNDWNTVHGGIVLGLADISLFGALALLRGADVLPALTLDISSQFIGPASADRPLDAVIEILRETKRLAFLRGLIVQDDDLVASCAGTIRKSPPKTRKA